MSANLLNILILSFSFLFIFTAFNTGSSINKVVVNSINQQYDIGWDAYISLCVLSVVYCFSNFFAPSLLALTNTKTCLIISSFGYLLYELEFLYPFRYGLIASSALAGLSAATLWVVSIIEI